jgi:hypothetical protein
LLPELLLGGVPLQGCQIFARLAVSADAELTGWLRSALLSTMQSSNTPLTTRNATPSNPGEL